MDLAVVYMVAGLSSRFGGKIKQFAKVGPKNETLIEYSINQAINVGFNKIIFIVGEKTEKQFKEMFGKEYKGIKVDYALQNFDPKERDKPWGTVDALCSAEELIDSPFVVCNGDDIYGEKTFEILFNHLKKENTPATIGYELKNVLSEEGTVNRGIFELEGDLVKSIKEVFEISKENFIDKGLKGNTPCSMNIFGFGQSILNNLKQSLERFKKEKKGDRKAECLLSQELGNMIKRGEIIMRIYPTPDKWFGVTNPEDEEKVREELKNLKKI
ncbi:NTP transferase domain-containing protein [Patescibacteria group bacterium]|nr:NTP transferase domain-containing protein [Patescibacteria group bacterium]